MFTQLKAWYLKTFLPFESQEHPLHAPTFCDEISDLVDAEMGEWGEEGPTDQRPIFNGSMILRSREWFEKNGMEFPEKR